MKLSSKTTLLCLQCSVDGLFYRFFVSRGVYKVVFKSNAAGRVAQVVSAHRYKRMRRRLEPMWLTFFLS